MKISQLNTSITYANTKRNENNRANPGFGSAASQGQSTLRKGFEWLGNKCEVHNGSLTRSMFFAVSILFLLGARVIESRDSDERREVITRDIPAIAIACAGAPVLNNAAAHLVTKNTGVPIAEYGAEKKQWRNAQFVSQKQVADWYSNLQKLDNPLITFSETIERNGGNLRKVMKKLGFENEMKALTQAKDNKSILEAFKNAQAEGNELFKTLEEKLKNVNIDNKLVKFAKKAQASVKVGCILLTAGILGYALPRLNIVTTANKYKNKKAGQNKEPRRFEPPSTFSNGVSIYHTSNAINAFKSFLG